MHSSPPARTPKLQLTAEQLLTGGCWNIPKKKKKKKGYPTSKDKARPGFEPWVGRTIAWKIPWTEEPGRLQSMGSQKVGHD